MIAFPEVMIGILVKRRSIHIGIDRGENRKQILDVCWNGRGLQGLRRLQGQE